uniref:Uncharacterized protein n=1 Tax=Meloidogyne enterolobii TaxID=390850 RepID=A0A6V7UV13_MELEN|nr:unnamed protein product [Meloidogyne enterolobii]
MLKLSKLILYHFLFVLLSLAIEFQSASSMLNWWNTEGQNSSTIHPEDVLHHLRAPPSTPLRSAAVSPVGGSPVRDFEHSSYGATFNQFGHPTFGPNHVESAPEYDASEWFPSSGGTSFAPSAVNSPTHPNMPTSLHHQNFNNEGFQDYYSQQFEDESYDGDSSYVSNEYNEFDGTDTGAQHNFHMMPGSSSSSAHRKGKKHNPKQSPKKSQRTSSPSKSKNVRRHRHLYQPQNN